MQNDLLKVLCSQEELRNITEKLSDKINSDYAGEKLLVVGVLKGSFVFLADIFRKIDIDCKIDFIAASSYGSLAQSSGNVKITKDLSADVSGYHVLIVEDILDTGNTLSYIKEYILGKNPLSVRICTLFDKPSRRLRNITADYVGKVIDDLFIVGYGLDYDERYRNLPYVGVLKPEIYSPSQTKSK